MTRLDRLREFLVARLVDASPPSGTGVRTRAEPHRHPGAAAQVAVIDDLLRRLAAGDLPDRWELRVMLFGYAGHPDVDPAWDAALRAWSGQ